MRVYRPARPPFTSLPAGRQSGFASDTFNLPDSRLRAKRLRLQTGLDVNEDHPARPEPDAPYSIARCAPRVSLAQRASANRSNRAEIHENLFRFHSSRAARERFF